MIARRDVVGVDADEGRPCVSGQHLMFETFAPYMARVVEHRDCSEQLVHESETEDHEGTARGLPLWDPTERRSRRKDLKSALLLEAANMDSQLLSQPLKALSQIKTKQTLAESFSTIYSYTISTINGCYNFHQVDRSITIFRLATTCNYH